MFTTDPAAYLLANIKGRTARSRTPVDPKHPGPLAFFRTWSFPHSERDLDICIDLEDVIGKAGRANHWG
jgi:hypothetical protein